jgi:alpha-aminoadipate/glutamate carrier protein LysW
LYLTYEDKKGTRGLAGRKTGEPAFFSIFILSWEELTMTTTTATCVECGADTPFGENIIIGEIVQCPDCGVELEVVNLEPLEVALAPEVVEDWGE